MTLRTYKPEIGKRVKLDIFEHYRRVSPDLPVWAWFTVRADNGDGTMRLEHYNAADTGEFYNVPVNWIAPPIGWRPKYTIYCKPEKVSDVLSWFARGIVVRASRALENAGSTAFQPMDNAAQPHWQFCEIDDAVQPAECARVFRVISVETQEINFVPDPGCERCGGSGRDTIARLASARKTTVEGIRADIAAKVLHNVHDVNFENGTFECTCRWGGFRAMGRSKRAKLIKQWKAEGWETRYVPYAGGWYERTRETIVHDWAE